MSNRRKIWSLPLVLVTALLLVGLFAASVLAQTPDPSVQNANVKGAVNGGTTIGDTDVLATVTIENWAANSGIVPAIAANPGATPPVVGFDNPAILGGPSFTPTGGTSTPVFEAVAGTEDTANGLQPIEVSLTSAAATAVDNGSLVLSDSYSFRVQVVVDRDDLVDGAADTDTTENNDRDITLTANVAINVMRIKADDLQFDLVPAKAVKGAVVSGLRNPIGTSPLEWEITGIGSSAKLVSIANDGLVDSGDTVPDFQIKETPAGSGKFRLFVNDSGADDLDTDSSQEISVILTYDEDTAVDSDGTTGGNTTAADENTDVTITITGDVTERNALALSGGNIGADGALEEGADVHYDFTIPSSTATNTPIGFFGVANGIPAVANTATPPEDNSVPAEYLDGIVTGADSAPFAVRDSDMTLVFDGSPALEVKTYEFDLTVSGDAGLASRTVIGKVRVTVTASNLGADAPATFTETVKENEPRVEVAADPAATPPVTGVPGLVKAGTEVGDASAGVTNPDNDTLAYSITGAGAAMFAIDEDSGMITVGDAGISDSTGGPTDDDADAKYARPANDGGTLVDDTDKYSDITYEFNITVSDGISANDKTIAATVTVDVNEQAVASVTDRQLANYSSNDPIGHEIFDLNTVVTDEDGDTLTYVLEGAELVEPAGVTGLPSTLPFSVNDAGMIVSSWTGLRVTDDLTWHLDAIVNDGFVNTDDDANDAVVQLAITLKAPEPQEAGDLSFSVAEESAAGTVLGSVAVDSDGNAIISDASSYAITHATGGASGADGTIGTDDDHFELNANNVLVVKNPRDFEGDKAAMPNAVTLIVEATGASNEIRGQIVVAITITNVNEEPEFDALGAQPYWVYEHAQVRDLANNIMGDYVLTFPLTSTTPATASAVDPDGDSITYSILGSEDRFGIDADGKLYVAKSVDLPDGTNEADVTITVEADDGNGGKSTMAVTIKIVGSNEDPRFIDNPNDMYPDNTVSAATPNGDGVVLAVSIPETAQVGMEVVDYDAYDPDGDTIHFVLRDSDDTALFEIDADTGVLKVKGDLDLKPGIDEGQDKVLIVEVNARDNTTGEAEVALQVTITNENDNPPVIGNTDDDLSVVENSPRGTVLGDYSATDPDDPTGASISYMLREGGNNKSFQISDEGVLMTLESLDADSNTPHCPATGCVVDVVATDGVNHATLAIDVTVTNADDSVSGFSISKANPIEMISDDVDYSMTALADAKAGGADLSGSDTVASHWDSLDCGAMLWLVESTDKDAYCVMYKELSDDAKAVVTKVISDYPAESPIDLPGTDASYGLGPQSFVSADWGNWGTVLRIEVTSPSPDADCGNGNQCVFVGLDADSSDENIQLRAYRSSTKENLFVAAVMLVKREDGGTASGSNGVYKHSDGSFARLIVDEEDDVEIRLIEKDADDDFVDSKVAPRRVEVENERPEFTNFMPEHEAAFDDGDVEYTFTITDAVSGVPEPEDLPDANGDGDYMPLVALVSDVQCDLVQYDSDGSREIPLDDNGKARYSEATDVHSYAGNEVWCKGAPAIWPITDDRDFDEVDDGFEVDTKIVLDENDHHYVTFVVCDKAGNCALYTPDNNEIEEAFARITVDTEDPVLHEARTGIMWDATDEELDKNNSTWIQVIFRDLSVIDEDSVEADDFVVKGHTVKDAKRYGDDADGDNARLDGDGTDPGNENTWRSIFLELEDELAPDEEPNVSVVPNGISDKAGNEQDDGDEDAKDYIAPSFTVVSIVSPRTPDAGMDDQLAGEDDEVVITLMSDERIQETRPKVTVTYVDAPADSVFTKTKRDTCDDEGTDDGYRVRGEIMHNDDCQDADAAQGPTLGQTIAKVSNTEWTIIVKEPESTGYYNIYIEGTDRSEQKNRGDEGIAPGDLVTDFFERDGDVNTDDAHFFQGDRNIANPAVWVSGTRIEDTEPGVEFKTPLFVELNFTETYLDGCEGIEPGSDEHKAKCFAESNEYAKDSFDSVTVTSFMLNGEDITDMVRTTDDETFLVSISGIEIGDHEIEIEAMDEAGNTLDKTLSVEFEVEERDDFSMRLDPGWNLVSIPGEPADSDISTVFGSDMEVRTVYTYNPIIPGGWMVAVRESADAEWQGDLKEITARQGYWVLSDVIQDWDVSIPRLAGGAVGSGTPIQPPVIALYAGWNLVPVIDVTGDFAGGGISATAYLQSLDDGLDLARVLGFDTITNKWSTIKAPESGVDQDLEFGSAYWVFVRQAASLVPGN